MISGKYYVKGSAPDPYEVVIKREDGKVFIICNCAAGKKSTLCKHRIGLVTNTMEGLIVDQSDDLSVAAKLLDGTVYIDLLKKIKFLDIQKSLIDKDLTNIKKQLSKYMRDGI